MSGFGTMVAPAASNAARWTRYGPARMPTCRWCHVGQRQRHIIGAVDRPHFVRMLRVEHDPVGRIGGRDQIARGIKRGLVVLELERGGVESEVLAFEVGAAAIIDPSADVARAVLDAEIAPLAVERGFYRRWRQRQQRQYVFGGHKMAGVGGRAVVDRAEHLGSHRLQGQCFDPVIPIGFLAGHVPDLTRVDHGDVDAVARDHGGRIGPDDSVLGIGGAHQAGRRRRILGDPLDLRFRLGRARKMVEMPATGLRPAVRRPAGPAGACRLPGAGLPLRARISTSAVVISGCTSPDAASEQPSGSGSSLAAATGSKFVNARTPPNATISSRPQPLIATSQPAQRRGSVSRNLAAGVVTYA
jgi:hypothetical protein